MRNLQMPSQQITTDTTITTTIPSTTAVTTKPTTNTNDTSITHIPLQRIDSIHSIPTLIRKEEECISPNNRQDDILTNIRKSNARLRQKLHKMPPLPKLSSFFDVKEMTNDSKPATTRYHCCLNKHSICAADYCKKYEKLFNRLPCSSSNCKIKHLQRELSCKDAHPYKCKTEPLSCIQQPLVLNQHVHICCDGSQQPAQNHDLTGSAELKSSQPSKSNTATTDKKSKKPVKIDVNVRLVPKKTTQELLENVEDVNISIENQEKSTVF